jgi:hypothetical protein
VIERSEYQMPFRYVRDIWAVLRQNADNDIFNVSDVGPPTDGTTGTGAGMLGPGSTYRDKSTGQEYFNMGTKASPVWSSGYVAGLAGLGGLGNAKATYDFAVDGGAISTITPLNSPTLPLGTIILGGTLDITTQLLGAGASIAVGFGSGAQIAALKASAVVAGYTVGQLAIIPIFTAATYYKLTAAAKPTITVVGGALTAGKMDINLVFMKGN